MEGLENYDPSKKPAASPAAQASSPSFLDKAKQFLSVMNNNSIRSGSMGMENRARAAEAAGAGAIRRHLPDAVNSGIDAVGNVPVLGHVVQPFVDAGPQSQNETMEQTQARVGKQLNSQDAQEAKDNPIASTAGTLAGSIPATIATTGAGTALGDSALIGKGLNAIKNATPIAKVGDVVAGTAQAAVKSVPNIAENSAYSLATDDSDDSAASKLARGALVGAASSPFGAIGTTAAHFSPLAVAGAEGAGAVFNKAVGSATARGAGSEIGNAIIDHDNQSTSDSTPEQTVDLDALMKHLNIDPNTPDGQQKAAQASPPNLVDHSDGSNTPDGQPVTPDVPQYTIQNGRTVLTTPSGAQVPVD